MKAIDLTPGTKINVELKANVIAGNESNKFNTKIVETVEKKEGDVIVTFKGSKAKYKATSGWMKPLDELKGFSGKLNYIVH